MEYQKFWRPLMTVAAFFMLAGTADGQYREKEEKKYSFTLVPGDKGRGLGIIQQKDGSKSRYWGPVQVPTLKVYPDRTNPLRGNIIYQDRQKSVSKQYDARPQSVIDRTKQRLELERNKHRFPTFP